MAYIFTDGFDCYAVIADMDDGYWDSISNVANFSLVAGRFPGSQALGLLSNNMVKNSTVTTDPVHHFSFAIQQTTAITGTTNGFFIDLSDGGTGQVGMVVNSGGQIFLATGTHTGAAISGTTYSGALTASNTWYQFEVEIVIHPTAGRFRVRKLGNTADDFDSGAVLNTRPGANTQANRITIGTQSTVQQIDDFLWRSDSVANGVAWVGDIRCQTRRPASDASVQWTPAAATVPQTLWTGTVTSVGAAVNRVVYTAFTARGDGTIASVTFTVNAAITSNMKCAIYNSNGSAPTTVVGAVSAQVTNPGSGSVTITFPTPPAVTAGGAYFLALAFDGSTGNVWGVSNTTGWVGTTTYASFPVNNPGSLSANNNCSSSLVLTPTYANTGQVCDPQQDGAASYVYSSTVGQSDLYGISSIATTPASIVAVTTRAYLQKSDAGTRLAAVQLKSGGVTVQSPSTALNTVWGWLVRTDTVDPNGGGPLTAVACNNMQVGVIVIGAPTTFNPSDKTAAGSLSGGNLTFTTGSNSGVRSVDNKSSGKWYWEYTLTTISGLQVMVGVANATASLGGIGGSPTDLCTLACNSGAIWLGNTTAPGNPNIGAPANGDVLCIALDANSNLIWLRRNGGNWNASGTASPGGTGGISTSGIASSGLYCVVASSLGVSGAVITLNAGPTGFAQSVPSGFTAGFLA